MGKMTARQVATELKKSARWHRDFGGELARQAYDKSADFVLEHLIETDEQRRERFELWCASRFPGEAVGDVFFRRDDGRYWLGWIEDRWEAFCAALTWHGEAEGGVA